VIMVAMNRRSSFAPVFRRNGTRLQQLRLRVPRLNGGQPTGAQFNRWDDDGDVAAATPMGVPCGELEWVA
jgi:hypothetical protein